MFGGAYSGMLVSGVACAWGSGAGGAWTCTGWVGAASSFLRVRVAAAFFAVARRVRVAAALRPAARRLRVTAAFLPAARPLRVEAAFFAAAWRRAALSFRVAAAFRPAVLRMGLNPGDVICGRRKADGAWHPSSNRGLPERTSMSRQVNECKRLISSTTA